MRGLLVELKIIGLPQQLQACMEQLKSAQAALSCQQTKTDTQYGVGLFETALRRQLPAGALKAVMLATSVLQEAKRIKAQHAKARCDAAYTFFTTSQDGVCVLWGPRMTAPYGEDVDGATLLALANAERGLLALAFRFLGSMWYIVSNPMLEQSFFQDFGNEQAIEAAQQLARELVLSSVALLVAWERSQLQMVRASTASRCVELVWWWCLIHRLAARLCCKTGQANARGAVKIPRISAWRG